MENRPSGRTPQSDRDFTERSQSDRRRDDRRQGDRRKGDRRLGPRGRRKTERSRSISTLVMLCFAAVMGLGLFLMLETEFGKDIDWNKMFFVREKDNTRFKLGGVSLGMSQAVVRKQHPNLDLASLGRGETVASFSFEGGNYTIWFIKVDSADKAYRMRYDQSFTTRTESEILESIGERHGKPGTSECTKAGELARKCHFQWWPKGGIALNVSTTGAVQKNGQMRTDVTVIATDTYLDGKRMRLQSKPRLPKTQNKTGEKKSPEKLPF